MNCSKPELYRSFSLSSATSEDFDIEWGPSNNQDFDTIFPVALPHTVDMCYTDEELFALFMD